MRKEKNTIRIKSKKKEKLNEKNILTNNHIFLINDYSLANENCSSYKKLSKEYLKCLGGKVKKKTSGFGLDTNNIKEKKYLTDWFKKKEK